MKKVKLSTATALLLCSNVYGGTIEIKQDWNLVGISTKQVSNQNYSIKDILKSSPSIESIITKVDGSWKSFDATVPEELWDTVQGFVELKPGMGYWIKSSADTNITVGDVPLNINDIKLNAGWNLVALNPTNLKDLLQLMQENGKKLESLITKVNGSWKSFDSTVPENLWDIAQGFTSTKLGQGYWVKVLKQIASEKIGDTDKTLIVYTDKEPSSTSGSKTITITAGGIDVKVDVPADTTKAEIRIVDQFGEEVVGGEVIDPQTTTSYTITKDINAITSVAYYVMSANPSGVPQPLSDVEVYNGTVLVGKTDANGIISISSSDVGNNATLTFQKDGYSVNSASFNLDSAIKYIVLSPSTSVNADELSTDETTTSSKVLNKTLDKYYAIKTLDNKAIGLVQMDNFSSNPNLSKVSFSFSSLDSSSFYGKDSLATMVAEYEKDGIKYVPQIITGVQGVVKVGGKLATGNDAKFSNIDRTGSADLTYYIPRFFVDTSYIRTQKELSGAEVKFYAYDGETWRTLDITNFDLVDLNTTGGAATILKKLGYSDTDLVAKVSDTTGIETVVGVLWNKESTLNVFTNVQVKVTETDGTVIKNALVKVLDQQVLTDENGVATFATIKVPNDLANLTFEVTEPNHYRNLDRVRINDLSDNKVITISLERPPSTGTVNISTIDENLEPVAQSLINIITPAVLADVNYENGIISVGKEDTAEYHWYIKPNTTTSSSSRIFRTLSRSLPKLSTDSWTEVASGVGKNSITVSDLMKTIIDNSDPSVGSVKLGVYVKHKNGLEDGSSTAPVEIGQADIMFNKNILEKLGLELIEEDPYVLSYSSTYNKTDFNSWGILGKATANTPYIAFSTPTNMVDGSLNVKWNVLLVYEKDSNDQYYWNGTKWVLSQDLKDAVVGIDYTETVYNIAKDNNMSIESSENYLTFNQLASFMSSEDVVKGLFINKADVDSNSDTQNIVDLGNNEDSVLAGTVRLIVVPEISFKDKFDSNTTNQYVVATETQMEGVKVSDLLNLADLALQPASILPHHIYAKASDSGMLRLANIPFEFGNAPDGQSYLDVLASKVGYLDSQRKTIPKFEEDNTTTPELEDVANVTLTLDKREQGSLEVTVVDADGNLVDGASLIVPSATVEDDKIANLLSIDNSENDLDNTSGVIKVSNIFEGGYNISVLKEGYKPATASVVVNKDDVAKATVHLEPLQTGIVLIKPFVNDLSFSQSNDQLTISGQVIDTEDGNYSNASQITLILNSKVIDIKADSDGKFKEYIKLDRGVNEAILYIANSKGTFSTSTKTFIYIGETAYFHGFVLDQNNNRLTNAIIEIDTEDGETIYRVSDSDGKYEVNDMPVGSGIISAVWIDDNGFIYNAKDKYQIDDNSKDVEFNLTIKTETVAISEPADVYIDTYNGASEIPSTVTEDKLTLVGRVVSFDKENGKLSFNIGYDDGTFKLIDVDNAKLVLLNKDTNTYGYKIDIPLKDGYNYIYVSAENPVFGGVGYSFVVEKASTNSEVTTVRPSVLLSTPSGLPVYAKVSIKTLDGSPKGVYEAEDLNTSYSVVEPELEPNKYYIFEITAPGFDELKEVKYVSQDSNFIYFVLTPTNDFSTPEQPTNTPPVVSIDYYNYQSFYEFIANAYDEDGDELTYSWAIDGVPFPSDGSYFDTELTVGTHNITVYVSDGKDEVNATTTVEVSNTNNPPKFNAINVPEGYVNNEYILQISATDPDGDMLYYNAENLPDGLYLDISAGVIQGYPTTAGTYDVTLTVSDGVDSDEENITIVIRDENTSLIMPPEIPDLSSDTSENKTLVPPPEVPSI